MRTFRTGLLLVLPAVVAALGLAVSAYGSTAATTVTVTAGKPSEFKFTLSKTAAAKGLVTFKVTNKGKFEHDFKIAARKTRLLKPGRSGTVSKTLAPGKYSFLCTVPGHAASGMKGTFTVRK